MGVEFPNKIGLAAGMDKNGDYIDSLASLGFGFLEIGTVTPREQYGNPKPRLFRLKEQRSLVNSMGFNNKGVDYAVSRIKQKKSKVILGVSIGKNFDTPNDLAEKDYLFCLERVFPISDYIALNISSPNTKGLRELGNKKYFDKLISVLKRRHKALSKKFGQKPLIVKISPDLDLMSKENIAKTILENEVDGIICSNTSNKHRFANQGGVSGESLFNLSNKSLIDFRKYLGSSFPIIASGGVMEEAHFQKKIELGADLVQVYTGMIYKGPGLINKLLRFSTESKS